MDFEDSFFCGDAAGRQKDHGNEDLNFARNVGLKFMTPEMLFLGKPLNFKLIPGLKIDEKYKDKIDAKLKPLVWIHEVKHGSPAA